MASFLFPHNYQKTIIMKRFTETPFFLSIKENENNSSLLNGEYEEFACRLLTDTALSSDRATCRISLIYISVELENLTGVSEKKCRNLSAKSHLAC
jgi:hypothetical protein